MVPRKRRTTLCVFGFLIQYVIEILVRTAERERRQTFHGEVESQLPFDLIRMHDTVSSMKISLSEGEPFYLRLVQY